MVAVKRRNSETANENGDAQLKKLAKIEKDFHSDDESSSDNQDEPVDKQEHKNTTAQDIQIARETVEVFKSSIFKLQIDELLSQLKFNHKHITKVESFLRKLNELISSIPDWKESTLSETEVFFKDKIVTIPFVDPKPITSNTHYKFNYKQPDVSLIGSFQLKTGMNQPEGSSIDMLLTMPAELFEKKDFLNFRCFHKRSVYLAYLTHHLNILLEKEQLSSFLDLQYSFQNNDSLLPILTISSKNENLNHKLNFYKSKIMLKILIGFPYKVFEQRKLLSNRNCIRVALDKKLQTNHKDNSLPATPLYNFAVLSSTTHEHYLKYLYKTKNKTDAFHDAVILGRLWLKQRGFSSNTAHSGGLGGFGAFEFSVLMSALLNGGGVNGNKILLHGFSSYQLFKGVIKYLATMDLSSQGHLQFTSGSQDDETATHSSKFVDESFDFPTIYDKSTHINILTKMTKESYKMLQGYSKETLKMLNNTVQDQFSNIFLTNLNKLDQMKYDLVFDISFASSTTNTELLEKFGPLEKVKYTTFENFITHKVSQVTNFALGDRVNAVEVQLLGQKTHFPISKRKIYPARGLHANLSSVRIKLLVNPAESEKLVTKGPTHSEEPSEEAIIFKKFWGSKSSLRRFKDGSIIHCCVWQTSSSEPVIGSILKFALRNHLSENIELIDNVSKRFQDSIPLPNVPASSKTSVLSLGNYFNLKKSFDELYKVIFNMQLPLSIKSLQPVGSAFRYTSLCQPVPFAYSSPDFFQDVILEFETSTKWPDEISSLEKSKTAFLLKIHEQIISTYHGKYKTFFTRDESVPYNLEITTLNILTPEGYGFRFRVLTERDEILYLRAISNARNELKPELEKTFLKFTAKYLASARHTRTIENISHSYQFYSPVVRLFKKWLDTHLLLSHLSDELVELIAMKPFVQAAPYFIPSSVENGFLKILKFLSQWNWKEDPLILDLIKPDDELEDSLETSIGSSEVDSATMKKLSEKLTLTQYKTMQTNFTNMRNSDPNGMNIQFFVASRIDPSGLLYSSDIPLPIATRITALSKVAINILETHGMHKQTMDLLFTPALKDYDFVVQLKSPTPLKISSGLLENSEFKNIANAQLPTKFPSDLSDISEKMDPTHQLVKYLNMKYKNSIIFSSHKYMCVNGGNSGDRNVITALIKPSMKENHKFKVNLDCNIKPISDETVVMNKDAIFHEIAAFGNEFVVEFQTK